MLKAKVEEARGDAAALELLYRESEAAGQEDDFKHAVAALAGKYPGDALVSAWAYRLDVKDIWAPVKRGRITTEPNEFRRWTVAILASLALGALFILLAGDNSPIPFPAESNPGFWIFWSPLIGLAVLFYLAVTDGRRNRGWLYIVSALIITMITLPVAWLIWGKTGDIANLTALHLPFIVWAIVCGSLVLKLDNMPGQFFSCVTKSLELMITAGMYLGAGMIFSGLTIGIFATLGIDFSETALTSVAAWGIGVIPVVALATLYNASVSPLDQSTTSGLANILRILTRLILPLALGVLAIYVFWFIPSYFWRPFQERNALIIYNVTILAVTALLAYVVPGSDEKLSAKYDLVLRYTVLATATFTLFLNAYALAAVASRALNNSLTPNRQATLGWNIVTLIMLTAIVVGIYKNDQDWTNSFRQAFARVLLLGIIWAFWVLFILPRF